MLIADGLVAVASEGGLATGGLVATASKDGLVAEGVADGEGISSP